MKKAPFQGPYKAIIQKALFSYNINVFAASVGFNTPNLRYLLFQFTIPVNDCIKKSSKLTSDVPIMYLRAQSVILLSLFFFMRNNLFISILSMFYLYQKVHKRY